jgi:imidazolonepropionase-like amidohydrolase
MNPRFSPATLMAGLMGALLVATQPSFGADADRALAIEHVAVVPMTTEGRTSEDMTVIVRDGRIATITPAGKALLPADAERIDGHGKWLMPALVDMHTHLENDRLLRLYMHLPGIPADTVRTQDILTPYLANGVLQVFDLSAMPETVGQNAEVESGRAFGPHIAMAAMIDGEPPILPEGITRVAATPEAGRQAVRDAADDGYAFIKAYGHLDLATFTAIVDEARSRKMRVIGHIPQRVKGITEKFFQPGYDMVAHAEEFAEQTAEPSEADIPRYVAMARRNGTWLVATLSLDERILQQVKGADSLKDRSELRFLNPLLQMVVLKHNPYVAASSPQMIAHMQRVVDFNRKLVRAFTKAGIPVLSGTDSPVPGVVPGFSLHDELEAMAKAGMTQEQVLAGATRLPAQWLGISDDRGTATVGKRADLLLLDGDPLRDVANTRRIAAVIDNGRYLPRSDLDRRMRELDARYTALREQLGKRH